MRRLYRTGLGGIQSKADYAVLLDRLGEALGDERAQRFHVHFSRIEFSAGGEKRHWTFAQTQFGPEPQPLMELLAERRLAPVIICEKDDENDKKCGIKPLKALPLGELARSA